MHDSSYNIMIQFRKLVEKHFLQEQVKVLEMKHNDVNYSYRELYANHTNFNYICLSMKPGHEVDCVSKNPYRWQKLLDESFDVIISDQTFEYIEYPWLIIEEMNRVLKTNGLICIIAPSRRSQNKSPVDRWRYSPYGFRALAKWVHLEVLEAKASWEKSDCNDESDQQGETFCILYKPEHKDRTKQHERKVRSTAPPVNSNSPLRHNKQNSYYGFARPEVVEAIIKNQIPTGNVLEVGCAGGATGKHLKDKLPVQSYVGIDISPEAADIAKRHLDRVIVADIEKTDLAIEYGLKPGEFDLLLVLDVLEHLYDPWDSLAELSYYVKPGGYVIASLPNIQNITVLQGLIKGNWDYQNAGILDATHLRFFTLEGSKYMFRGAGLTIKNIEHVINPSLDMEKLKESGNKYSHENLEISNLTKKDFLHLFTYQYILVAQKSSSSAALNTASQNSVATKGGLLPAYRRENIVPQMTSIVILTFNQLEYTKKCLKSLLRHTPDHHEIIFVDNGSTDGTVLWLRKLMQHNTNFKLIENKRNLGFAKGCNQGIGESSGEFIILLNNDVVVTGGWLTGMLECLKSAPDAGIVGPMTNNISGPQQVVSNKYRSVDDLENYSTKFKEHYRHRRIQLRRIVGFCMLFRRSLIDQIGMMDQSFGTGNFEDDDFCLRATLEGFRNYIAGDVFIHHYGSRSFIGNNIAYGTTISRNKKLFDEKWNNVNASTSLGRKVAVLKSLEKAEEHFQRQEINQAVTTLIDAIRYLPDYKLIYFRLAEILIDSERFGEALEVLNSMSEDGKHEGRWHALTGYCKQGMGLHAEAGKHAEDALVMDTDSSLALNLKGRLANKGGNNEAARRYFEKAIESDPGYGTSYTNLGALQWTAGNKEEALDLLEKGFVLSPTVSDTISLYHAVTTATKEFERAEMIARKAKELYPLNKRICFFLIDLLIKQNKNAFAMEEIERVMTTFRIDEAVITAALEIRKKVGIPKIDIRRKPGTLSACMIVKNEEDNIARCLASLKPVADEIIVVDTGSKDKTKEISRAFGAQVYEFVWTDDFSEARNLSMSKARGEWILVHDADEVISDRDYDKLRIILDQRPSGTAAYSLITRNYTKDSAFEGWTANSGEFPDEEMGIGWFPSPKVRLLVNDKRFRFENPIHELLEPSLKRAGVDIKACAVVIHHYGQISPERVKAKAGMYYLLGKKKLESAQNQVAAIRELAVQARAIGRYDEAIELWNKYITINPDHYLPYFNMSGCYFEKEDFYKAFQKAKKAFELNPISKEVVQCYATTSLFCNSASNAIKSLESLLQTIPAYPTGKMTLATAYCITGTEEKGVQLLKEMKRMAYDCSEGLYNLSKKFIAAGKIDSAILLLESMEKSGHVHPDGAKLLQEFYHDQIINTTQ